MTRTPRPLRLRQQRPNRSLFAMMIFAAAVVMAACSSIGPERVPKDRLDYADSLSVSWQRQMLLNIVKLRYGEMPMFLDVTSVINQYTTEGSFSTFIFPGGNDEFGARGSFSDRPTVTYQPLTGEAFTTSLLTPLSPIAMFSLVQAGWPVDLVMNICVRRINGINNQSAGLVRAIADPEFLELVNALSELQQSGRLMIRLTEFNKAERVEQERGVYLMLGRASHELAAEAERAKELLGLDLDAQEVSVAFGGISREETEIAMLSRSVLDIMLEMAFSVRVPERDVVSGRAGDSIYDTPEGSRTPRRIQIHSGERVPDGTRIAVPYRDIWFWIEDTDLDSKVSLAFLLTLFSLSEGSSGGGSPLLTIN